MCGGASAGSSVARVNALGTLDVGAASGSLCVRLRSFVPPRQDRSDGESHMVQEALLAFEVAEVAQARPHLQLSAPPSVEHRQALDTTLCAA